MDEEAPPASCRPEPVRRTIEIEDFTNLYFVHVIASRLTRVLARLHVTPNAVSISGMACGIAAGIAYYGYRDPRWSFAGFALMIAWHVADGVDGQLARLTRTQSEIGKVLDGICDYVTFAAVYLALAVQLARVNGGIAWIIVAVAGACHALQSAAFERQRQDYEVWGLAKVQSAATGPRGDPHVTGWLQAAYERVQVAVAGSGHDRLALDALLRSEPDRAASIRRRYRDRFARPVRRWAILSANYRTIGIFLCALAQAPMFYFLFEITGFSLILAILSVRQRARLANFLKEIESRPATY